jgi:outer membrane murein-binding lipoprotein Lpp
MGASLTDFIKELPRSKTLPEDQRTVFFQQKADVDVLTRYGISKHAEDAAAKLHGMSRDLSLAGYAVLPTGNGIDTAQLTTTESARELADHVGFMIMPFEYLADSYAPPYEARRHITQLINFGLSIYVMAPVTAYSLQKNLKKADMVMHVPEDVSQAFMALTMSIPVFRAMQRQLDELQDHVRDYRARISNLATEVQALTQRVDAMAEQAARQRARAHAEAADVKIRQEEIIQWYRHTSDPLVLGLPAGKTIRDDTPAFIGPAWGELPPAIVKALSLKPRQRQTKVRG